MNNFFFAKLFFTLFLKKFRGELRNCSFPGENLAAGAHKRGHYIRLHCLGNNKMSPGSFSQVVTATVFSLFFSKCSAVLTLSPNFFSEEESDRDQMTKQIPLA